MSDPNGFRRYEAAIINGLLVSGSHDLADIHKDLFEIRKTARAFSGSVTDVYYPTGISNAMADTARLVLYRFLDIPKPLAVALGHMAAQGFDDRVTHYTINVNTGVYAYMFNLNEIDGVPMLSREIAGGAK